MSNEARKRREEYWNKWGGAAFPTSGFGGNSGMSLRDWFASMALSSLTDKYGPGIPPSDIAEEAYEFADAMIKERQK